FPMLSELNYGLWSENMKALLKTKGLWGVVSGMLPFLNLLLLPHLLLLKQSW
ncbi:hypothetical protein JAAARDRAFT_128177, partial [Jaapia argillacea MUCL 33604]